MNSKEETITNCAIILTEGPTDWQHLKKAQEKLGINLDIRFHETEEDLGGENLLKQCRATSKHPTPYPTPVIFVFDRDVHRVIKEVDGKDGEEFKDWGKNVFSFAIPIPEHRKDHQAISIEFYYTNEELTRKDSEKRRLFLSSEFDKKSGNHRREKTLHVKNANRIEKYTEENKSKIVDSDIAVIDLGGNNIALSKMNFTKNIVEEKYPFNTVNFEPFRKIFQVIEKIIQIHSDAMGVLPTSVNSQSLKKPQEKEFEDLVIKVGQLTLTEQILIHLICKLGRVKTEVIKFLALAMKTSPEKSYERIVRTDICDH